MARYLKLFEYKYYISDKEEGQASQCTGASIMRTRNEYLTLVIHLNMCFI